jgi:hypothetical protein
LITSLPRVAIAARDFEALLGAFRDALGMPVIDLSSASIPGRGARLAMCVPPGGSNIERMSPAVPAALLARSLERSLARRSDGSSRSTHGVPIRVYPNESFAAAPEHVRCNEGRALRHSVAAAPCARTRNAEC